MENILFDPKNLKYASILSNHLLNAVLIDSRYDDKEQFLLNTFAQNNIKYFICDTNNNEWIEKMNCQKIYVIEKSCHDKNLNGKIIRINFDLPIDQIINEIISKLDEPKTIKPVNQNIKNNVLYWAIDIIDPFDILLIGPIRTWIQNNPSYKINENFHITLLFIGNNRTTNIEYRENNKSQFEIDFLCYDNKCACLRISQLDVLCKNQYPHITLGLKDGTKPVYSNQMLESGNYKCVPINIILTGQIKCHLK